VEESRLAEAHGIRQLLHGRAAIALAGDDLERASRISSRLAMPFA
jgi:hypothetical protein